MFLDQDAIKRYGNAVISGTSSIPFREVPRLVQQYVEGNKALDVGCGAGRSSRFLKVMGLHVTGVDLSEEFLSIAREKDPEGEYFSMEGEKMPFERGRFDLVFSSFVLFMLSSREQMLGLVGECYRVLRDGGIGMFITGSDFIHSPKYQWVSYENDFPENYCLVSGAPVRLKVREADAIFQDYQWIDSDYQEVFAEVGFEVLEVVKPLGLEGEWLSEKETPPFYIYVVEKRGS